MSKPPPLNVPTKSIRHGRNPPSLARSNLAPPPPPPTPPKVPEKSMLERAHGPQHLSFQAAPVNLPIGRQLTMAAEDKESILASATFRLSTVEGTADFAELGGITSEVENTEYMDSGPFGTMFTRHAGRSKPPVIVLKRAMRTGPSTLWIWTWHQAARSSLPNMHRQAFLTFFGPGEDSAGVGRMTYALANAWPSKVEIAGVKAGSTEVIMQTVTLQCDELLDPNAV
jgi:phage tail-like protein